MNHTPLSPSHTQEKEVITNALLLSKKVFNIPSQNVRDAIIEIVRSHMPGTAFAGPFIAHLSKMGRKSLDQYDDLEFALGEHHVTLRFQCPGRTDAEAMRYTIDHLTSEPNEAFKDKPLAAKLKFWR